LTEIKKILVIRLSSFGDIILSFPLLKLLNFTYPESQIHFLTKKNYVEVIALNPSVTKIIEYGDSIKGIRNEIRNEKYDLIIDIHKNFRSTFVSIFNGSKVRRYYKDNFRKFLLVKFKWNLFREVIPVYRKYILAIKDQIKDTSSEFTTTELKFDRKRIYEYEYIVISPSSRHFTKTLPAEKFIGYINSRSDRKFILTGDDSERDKKICGYIETNCRNVFNLCGKLNIQKLANVIYYSESVICNDSAILHLAEALGKKVTAVFGSTVKEFGFFPQLAGSEVLEIKDLKCRPCTHIGRESCPEGHFNCMELITNYKLEIKNN
jgi:ADP-heptose:LPS heptosyltransferase